MVSTTTVVALVFAIVGGGGGLPLHGARALQMTASTPSGGHAAPTVAVVGASGRLGRKVVDKLAAAGATVRCLQRGVAVPSIDDRPNVKYVRGDVGDVASLTKLLDGCAACVAAHGATRRTKLRDLVPYFLLPSAESRRSPETSDPTHAKQVNYEGVANLIAAARAAKCSRIVRVTGKGEQPFSLFSILINGLGSMAKAWNYEGECLLRAARDVDYTIVRPGVMMPASAPVEDVPDRFALADDGGALPVKAISYDDVADLLTAVCLEDAPNTRRATLTAMTTVEPDAPTSWTPLLAGVRPDRRAFPPTLLARHKLAVRLGMPAIVCLVAGLLVGAAKLLAYGGLALSSTIGTRLCYAGSWCWEDIFAVNEM